SAVAIRDRSSGGMAASALIARCVDSCARSVTTSSAELMRTFRVSSSDFASDTMGRDVMPPRGRCQTTNRNAYQKGVRLPRLHMIPPSRAAREPADHANALAGARARLGAVEPGPGGTVSTDCDAAVEETVAERLGVARVDEWRRGVVHRGA